MGCWGLYTFAAIHGYKWLIIGKHVLGLCPLLSVPKRNGLSPRALTLSWRPGQHALLMRWPEFHLPHITSGSWQTGESVAYNTTYLFKRAVHLKGLYKEAKIIISVFQMGKLRHGKQSQFLQVTQQHWGRRSKGLSPACLHWPAWLDLQPWSTGLGRRHLSFGVIECVLTFLPHCPSVLPWTTLRVFLGRRRRLQAIKCQGWTDNYSI